MNDLLKDKLSILADDELMIQAITEVVKNRIRKEKPDINKTDDDRILGQKFRAFKEAENLLWEAIEDINSYKIQRSNNNQVNKGK